MTPVRRVAVVDLNRGRTVAVVDLASRNGQHIPGTPYNWRHGWIPLNARVAERFGKLTSFRRRRDRTVLDRATSRRVLQRLSDSAVGRLYDRFGDHPSVAKTVARELDRRDRADRARKRLAARREDHQLAVHAQFLAAEAETRGNMLNRAGRAAGVDPESLFTGTERRAHKYASEELLKFWDRHPRLTVTEYMRQSRQLREAA